MAPEIIDLEQEEAVDITVEVVERPPEVVVVPAIAIVIAAVCLFHRFRHLGMAL